MSSKEQNVGETKNRSWMFLVGAFVVLAVAAALTT